MSIFVASSYHLYHSTQSQPIKITEACCAFDEHFSLKLCFVLKKKT